MFRGSVKGTGYPLHSPVSPSLTLPCVTVCHHISTGLHPFYRRLSRPHNIAQNSVAKEGMHDLMLECVWNVTSHEQKPDFLFQRNGRVYLSRRVRQFSRLLAGELCTSACRVCTARASLCSAVMWRLLVTNSIRLFPIHFSSRASPCAITFQMQSTKK
jgi:hypothetical protein